MDLEHLLSPIQEQKLRIEARQLRQDNARLKMRLEKALEKADNLEEEKNQLKKADAEKEDLIKSLKSKIEQLELDQIIKQEFNQIIRQREISGDWLSKGRSRDLPNPSKGQR